MTICPECCTVQSSYGSFRSHISFLPASLPKPVGHLVDDINKGKNQYCKQVTVHQAEICGGIFA